MPCSPITSSLRSGWWPAPIVDGELKQVAIAAEKELLGPLFEFRNYGVPLAGNWTTQSNGAQFGTDYLTRAAVAKSNIFVNVPSETKYFYQDLDNAGARLNGSNRYAVTWLTAFRHSR